jgi:mediator of RNA polymerase II transcription subunit 16, fungi type
MPDPRQDPHLTTGTKLSVENVRPSVPYQGLRNPHDQDDDPLLFDGSSHLLSHLEIIPTSDIEKALQLPPTIVAFYTPVVNALGMVNEGQLDMTTIRRWHVVSTEPALHPNFDAIPPKVKSTSSGRTTDLQRLEDVHINQIITTVQKIDSGELLALGSADGSLAMYDPTSLTQSYMAQGSNEVTSIAQAGFTFPSFARGLHLSVSPNACVAASITNDGKMQLTHIEHPNGVAYGPLDSSSTEAAMAAIILSFARSFYSQVSWNDILLLVTQTLQPTQYPQLTQSALKDLIGDRDFIHGQDLEKVPQKPIVSRMLSLAASLGHNLSHNHRNPASMLSWLTLNIRFCALTFMMIWASVKQNGGLEWKEPEVCELACNNIKWTLDLCKFMVDDLFEMVDRDSSSDDTSITKLLLLSIWPRSFLKMIARILRGFVRATQDPNTTLSPEAAPAFSRMAELIESSPLKMESLEQLLSGADKLIMLSYQARSMSDRDKAETERYILSHGAVPEVLQDVVPRVLQDVLPMTRKNMDRLALYMEDYSWLGIRGEEKKTRAFKREFVVDVYRKRVLKREELGRYRRCVRCGSVSKDLVRVRSWPGYLQQQILRCICEDVFAVVGGDEG